MEKKEKQKYIKWIIFNWVFIFCFLLFIFIYAIGTYDEIWNKSLEWNTLNAEIKDIKNNWLKEDEVEKKFSESSFTDTKNVFDDKKKVELAIKKPLNYSKNYSDWLNDEISKIDIYNNEIEKNKKILWNIIPAFSDYNDWTSTWSNSNLTLESFISYIEDNILKKYNLESFSTVWIDNVSFDNSKSNSSNIWFFKVSLDISWKGTDIRKFIDDIQNSWKININKWKLVWSIDDSDFNNLLITIDDLKLDNNIDNSENDNMDIKWSIGLRFYIKWIWLDDYILIKNKIWGDLTKLVSNILSDSKICDGWTNLACKDNDWNKAVSDIRSLVAQVNMIKTGFDALSKNKVTDPSKEVESLYQVNVSMQSIQSFYNQDKQILNKFSKWTK